MVTHNGHWNQRHFITDIKTAMCVKPGQRHFHILMFQVLAFLLAWGVGAAPESQRLRRSGEAQRDFGPISSTDLATHFGENFA